MHKSLIVSGYKGYIGSHFCKILKKKGIRFYKFDFEKKKKKFKNFSHFFHFSFDINIKKNSLKKNEKRLLKVLDICKKNNIKLIFPSTCTYKYSRNNKRISNKIFAINKYSRSKIRCENKILNYSKKYKLDYFIFRIFNVYGGNNFNRGVVSDLINKFRKYKTFNLHYSQNTRDFINLEDLSNLFLKSLFINKSGIFDVGSGKSISIRKLAVSIKKVFKFNSNLIFVKPVKSSKNNYSKSNIYNTKLVFSWKPKIDLTKGLKKLSF